MKLSGIKMGNINKSKQSGAVTRSYIIAFISSLLIGYVLALFVNYLLANTFIDGMNVGFLVWLGFVAPMQISMVIWEGKPVKLYILNIAYSLIGLSVGAGILSVLS